MARALSQRPAPLSGRRVAVIGAGWAGLAAAVALTDQGAQVTLLESSPLVGGRARSDSEEEDAFDNGQHILIGAYTRTLALLRRIGVVPESVLWRCPLQLRFADGAGLAMRAGWPPLAFARALVGFEGLAWADRAALLRHAVGWRLSGFRCDGGMTVHDLCCSLPPTVRQRLIDPLCIAALNTPAALASASTFLRVIKDSMFGVRGGSDLLLPRRPLGQVLPAPAKAWLQQRGARILTAQRVLTLAKDTRGWHVDGEPFDGVVLSSGARESARLAEAFAPRWSQLASGLRYEPIVTVYVRAHGASLPAPMTALLDGPEQPAQFVFDHGSIGSVPGRCAFVVSGAARWVEAGTKATAEATLRQALEQLGSARWPSTAVVESLRAERRATFSCTPGLQRPPIRVAEALVAAGDHVDGPYPATLEGAVRSADEAVAALIGDLE